VCKQEKLGMITMAMKETTIIAHIPPTTATSDFLSLSLCFMFIDELLIPVECHAALVVKL
jgi:hypothetical protein